ncbi:hypothetical protein N7E81_15315 [Reichenbachiella carrageenanivorans]|uniref:DUF6436 domain-containing protein n=1 Tax=Reichenbachiella carrageenanivorans TaxID=2979869 RepID=A0ABY6CXX5_9BACT|nr:hypothetical protein [Reichenbachiella carrageenanivorans]UXX78728.1 hypothetical protein N7E81_15315 [Reichenbachiella carrageenanivorans]
MNNLARKALAAVFMLFIMSIIAWLFWKQELQYTLPTPVPPNYKVVYVNESVPLDNAAIAPLQYPKFYHFFKPDCPCSRFNVKHFNYLQSQFANDVDFVVVIPEGAEMSDAVDYFDGKIQVMEDVGDKLANGFGVYSTPQAVIVNTDGKLYFRGNYNKARYCTDAMSNFAQMALDSLMSNKPAPKFGPLATVSYGCGLPKDDFNLLNF